MESHHGHALERLLDRATFGVRPGEIARWRAENHSPEEWFDAQVGLVDRPDPELERRLVDAPRSELPRFAPGSSRLKDPSEQRERRRSARRIAEELAGTRIVRAVHARAQLAEVMTDFWCNHFNIYAVNKSVGALLPHYEREVIARHAMGRFEDLLLAVARSPAMLFYLDNWVSTAPVSPGRRRRPRSRGGINENYARELLELHTLGVDGGYGQSDVLAVARVMTGWSLKSRDDPQFAFHAKLHDWGPKNVLGERVEGRGIEEGEGLLRRLARHPSTAEHLARKLAVRFVADAPPPVLVERAKTRFLETGGELSEVLRTVLLSPELSEPSHRKLKTPLRFVASALRTTDGETDGGPRLCQSIAAMGGLPFFARTPAGHPECAEDWLDPAAALERIRLAFMLARGTVAGTRLGPVLPGFLDRGEGRARLRTHEKFGLALASPEFQWS
ncbi:DUF1800 domain-containing protein [Myxococcota bacterium]|nr:DUF1800 domain-containing protein [Myxococcota bacterium]